MYLKVAYSAQCNMLILCSVTLLFAGKKEMSKPKQRLANHLFGALQQVYDKVQTGEYVEHLILVLINPFFGVV